MAIQEINVGSVAGDSNADTARDAFTKVNANFTELLSRLQAVERGRKPQEGVYTPTGVNSLFTYHTLSNPAAMASVGGGVVNANPNAQSGDGMHVMGPNRVLFSSVYSSSTNPVFAAADWTSGTVTSEAYTTASSVWFSSVDAVNESTARAYSGFGSSTSNSSSNVVDLAAGASPVLSDAGLPSVQNVVPSLNGPSTALPLGPDAALHMVWTQGYSSTARMPSVAVLSRTSAGYADFQLSCVLPLGYSRRGVAILTPLGDGLAILTYENASVNSTGSFRDDRIESVLLRAYPDGRINVLDRVAYPGSADPASTAALTAVYAVNDRAAVVNVSVDGGSSTGLLTVSDQMTLDYIGTSSAGLFGQGWAAMHAVPLSSTRLAVFQSSNKTIRVHTVDVDPAGTPLTVMPDVYSIASSSAESSTYDRIRGAGTAEDGRIFVLSGNGSTAYLDLVELS